MVWEKSLKDIFWNDFWHVRGSVDASEKDPSINEEEEVEDSEGKEDKVNGNTILWNMVTMLN